MRKGHGSVTRHELSEKSDCQAERRRELHRELEEKAQDISTVRQLKRELDLAQATSDGAAEIEASVESANDVSEEQFDRQDGQLEDAHRDARDDQADLSGRRDASDSNLAKISSDTASLKTRETIDKIRESKEAAIRETEFLEDLERRAMDSLAESERIADALRAPRQPGA